MTHNQHRYPFFFRLLPLLLLSAAAFSAKAQTIFALADNNLISFNAATPGTLTGTFQITGVAAGQSLVGLDFRPATGQLYALGYNSTTGEARLYTINRTSGAATAVGAAAVTLSANMGDIGFDFNPTVDRIRVTGSNDTNYRLHPVTGAIAATDGNLAFAAGDVNAGVNPNIGTLAYTNSYIGAPSTILYNYDLSLNIFTTQAPPNNGTLNSAGASGLNLSSNALADLDIYFDPATSTNQAFFAANSVLYTVSLPAGTLTSIGTIGGGRAVRDIAVLIERTVPATVTGDLLYALTTSGSLISFDAAQPGIIRTLVAITGIAMGQVLSGLDFRPATGELYTLGYNSATGEARLYTINLATGVATAIGAAPVTLAIGLGKVSFDFNPTVDRIRVTGSNNANYRLHPVTGAIAATDANLAFAGGDVNAGRNPSIGTGAYTNSFAGTTTTTLFNYDDSLNVLTTQIPPNNGTLNTVGASGISQNLTDPTSDLDIFYDRGTAQNRAYLVANPGSGIADNLYTVNLATGVATLVGKIGNGIAVTDVAAFIMFEAVCDVKTTACVRFEILSVRRDAVNNKVYRIRVTNTCSSALNYVAFQVPDGVTAVAPATNSMYAGAGGRTYTVRNPNFSPFYSIRFKTNGVGLSGGQSDVFEYSLPQQTNVQYILLFARLADGTGYEAYGNTFDCPAPAAALGNSERENELTTEAAGNMTVYPNPTTGQVFVNLSAWSGQRLQLTVFDVTGRQVQRTEVEASPEATALQLPGNLTSGFYYLGMTAPDGTKRVQRLVVQR